MLNPVIEASVYTVWDAPEYSIVPVPEQVTMLLEATPDKPDNGVGFAHCNVPALTDKVEVDPATLVVEIIPAVPVTPVSVVTPPVTLKAAFEALEEKLDCNMTLPESFRLFIDEVILSV